MKNLTYKSAKQTGCRNCDKPFGTRLGPSTRGGFLPAIFQAESLQCVVLRELCYQVALKRDGEVTTRYHEASRSIATHKVENRDKPVILSRGEMRILEDPKNRLASKLKARRSLYDPRQPKTSKTTHDLLVEVPGPRSQ